MKSHMIVDEYHDSRAEPRGSHLSRFSALSAVISAIFTILACNGRRSRDKYEQKTALFNIISTAFATREVGPETAMIVHLCEQLQTSRKHRVPTPSIIGQFF